MMMMMMMTVVIFPVFVVFRKAMHTFGASWFLVQFLGMQLDHHRVLERKSSSVCCAVNGKIVSSRQQLVCETPLLTQVHDQLAAAGTAGLSIAELARQLGLQLLDCRMLLKNLCRKGFAVCTLHDQGKAGIQRSAIA